MRAPAAPEPGEAPGGVERLTAHSALDDLRAVLQLCQAGALRVSEKTARPSAKTVATVAGSLAVGDVHPDAEIAAFAWPLLLQAGRLARSQRGVLALTAAGRRALAEPSADVVRGLWQRWVTHGLLDELSRVENIKGQRSANALSAVKPRRALVAQALVECVGPEWVTVDDLFSRMRRRGLDPAVVRPGRAIWKLYLGDPQYGSLGYLGFGEWSILQGRYTLAVLFEYAATLGLIDVRRTDPAGARDDFRDQWGGDDLDALSRYDGLLAMRRTPLGSFAVGATAGVVGQDDPEPTTPPR